MAYWSPVVETTMSATAQPDSNSYSKASDTRDSPFIHILLEPTVLTERGAPLGK